MNGRQVKVLEIILERWYDDKRGKWKSRGASAEMRYLWSESLKGPVLQENYYIPCQPFVCDMRL